MQAITIKDVLCRECGFPATLDANKTCEFCRPRKVTITAEESWMDFEKEDLLVLAFAIVVLGFLIYFAPMAAR